VKRTQVNRSSRSSCGPEWPTLEEKSVKYVVLAVASDVEAERLIEDLTRYPAEPLRTPRWGNAVHATLVTEPAAQPDRADTVAVHRTIGPT
jgi:hypothetical protein